MVRPPLASMLILAGMAATAREAAPKEGDVAPPIRAEAADGNAVVNSQLQGKVVLLTFWKLDPRSGSGMPQEVLRALRSEFRRHDDFLILTVCLPDDEVDIGEPWSRFEEKRRSSDSGEGATDSQGFSKWWDALQMDEEGPTTAQRYGAEATPSYFLIDRDGRLAAARPSQADLREAIARAFTPKP